MIDAPPAKFRVTIAKNGSVFWRSKRVNRTDADRIRRKNQKLIDSHQWAHTIAIEEAP